MESISVLKKFIDEFETFRLTPEYQKMPNEQRDFANEELGRFKAYVEIFAKDEQNKDKEKDHENHE